MMPSQPRRPGKFVPVLALVFLVAGCGGTLGGVKVLKDLGDDMGAQKKAVEEETRHFEKVKKGLLEGDIRPGLSEKTLVRRYGKPTVILEEPPYRRYAYKPGDADWFKGEKAYLDFNAGGELENIRCGGFECPSQKSTQPISNK